MDTIFSSLSPFSASVLFRNLQCIIDVYCTAWHRDILKYIWDIGNVRSVNATAAEGEQNAHHTAAARKHWISWHRQIRRRCAQLQTSDDSGIRGEGVSTHRSSRKARAVDVLRNGEIKTRKKQSMTQTYEKNTCVHRGVAYCVWPRKFSGLWRFTATRLDELHAKGGPLYRQP